MRRITNSTPLFANLVVLGLLTANCPNNTNPTPPPAAAAPVLLPVLATDPAGAPVPTGAPALQSSRLKFTVPTGTDIQISVENWILRRNGQVPCGDDGCYDVISSTADGAGTTTWLIQVWPRSFQRRANQLDYQITDVSFNAGLTGPQAASAPLKVRILAGIDPTLGTPNPFGQHGTSEYASINETQTLAFPTIDVSSAQDAKAYYDAIDPTHAKITLAAWRSINGFSATDDSKDDATATYFNAGDLDFGRSMHMKAAPNGDVAYYVSNYPTVDDAQRHTNLIATVAMEYSAGPQGGAKFVKFYVYNANGDSVHAADLDGNGAKPIPNLCIICHGQSKYVAGPGTDVGARFLPFDLASYQYGLAPIERTQQEDQFRKLNLGILGANPTTAESDLIQAWYHDGGPTAPANTNGLVQNSDAVPSGWSGKEDLYLKVIKVSCRACHVTRDGDLSLNSFTNLGNVAQRAQNRICGSLNMPNAKVTYQRFWLERLGAQYASQVGVINQSGVTNWAPPAGCPDAAAPN